MHGAIRRLLVRLVPALLFLVLLPASAMAQRPLDPKAVPDPLKPWEAWALDGVDRCPGFYDHADQSRCVWPARLELVLGERGGTFTQRWHVDAALSVPLPGNAKHWPMGVAVDGKPALVVTAAGEPRVSLPAGEHSVSGTFMWDSLPESLAVPRETGLLTLTLKGAKVATPNRDAQGTVFFQKASTEEEGNALGVVVHRKVTDDIPQRLVTRIELHVSGKSREELLGKALPAGFIPMSLESTLPARVEADGRIRVQVRPGVFVIELTARAPGPVAALTRPAPEGPWKDGDEVWVFEARGDYRVVSVEGVSSIDPQQTTLPDAWKRFPAYPMAVGATMRFVESRRGDADPPPDQLSLSRSLWLDFDGQGYTVQDVITGVLNRESRLTMAPPTVLGRVAMNGRDQFITTTSDAPGMGVEVRQVALSVTADSRVAGSAEIPAVGWAHDFHQVTGALHLPPGWSLLYATGVDDVPGTWVRHWSLLEIFLALMIGIVIGRLYGIGWGALALAMLVLTLPEVDAPKWCWIPLLVLEALVRVLAKTSARRAQRVFEGLRMLAFLVLGIVALPFVIQQVRQGLHPALVQGELVVGSGGEASLEVAGQLFEMDKNAAPASPPMASAAAAPTPTGTPVDALKAKEAVAEDGKMRAEAPRQRPAGSATAQIWQSNGMTYDPAAIVQTGPGLPRWRWTTLDLKWSGPVAARQRLHLYLLSPAANLALALLRAALLIVVVLRVFPYGTKMLPRILGPRAALATTLIVFGALTGFAPRVAHADIPDKATLDELNARLLRPPSCSPTCASSERMAIDLQRNVLRLRIEIDVATPTAVPLPGTGSQWSPADVLVDGHSAQALARVDDVLWLALDAGRHEVVLQGAMPDRASVQISLPMKPHHVEATAAGWTVAGVHEDGLADDDLQFTRTETASGHAGAVLQPGTLPPFVEVTRTLHVGLDWEMDTRVTRETPVGSAVVLEIPLIPGEQVTTADVRVATGRALVFLGPDATTFAWHSVLAQKSPIKLVAPSSVPWTEVWQMDVGSIWHATYSGIPFVHSTQQGATKVPEWRPWPGETAEINLTRPDGVPGQTLTIDESTTALEPGLRSTDVTVTLSLRSSRGGDHTIRLPEGAELESLSINQAAQPIRQEGRKVTVPIVPGAETLKLTFRDPSGITTVFASPSVDLGAPSVNATITVSPGARWLLVTSGPRVGPAILFWSLLIVLLVVALALGKNHWTPLRAWHWMLLFVGLSQLDVIAGGFFVGWILALGYRARDEGGGPTWQWFNLRQIVLVAWTLAALVILAFALHQGLLGAPEMQVTGNGSSSSLLRWFSDRGPAELPRVHVVSVPLLVYRAAMLAWALWIVLSLLSWLRWGWGSFVRGGAWKKGPPRAPRPPPAYAMPYYAPGAPPPSGPVAPEDPVSTPGSPSGRPPRSRENVTRVQAAPPVNLTSPSNGERLPHFQRWVAALATHGPIAGLLVISGALRAYRLPDMPGSLIGDEVWYVQAARVLAGFPVLMNHLPANALSGLDPNFEHPPLAKVVMAESMRLLGNREIAWRIPSVVLGTLSIWLLYRVILALRGTREQALFGAFVLSFDSLFFLHGRIGTLDIYFVTLMLVGTWLYVSSYLELAAIAFAVGALCKMNAVLGLLAMFLYDAVLARTQWRSPSWRAIGRRALVVALFAAFFLLGLGALDAFFTRFRSPFEHLAEMAHFHAGLKHVGLSSGTESTPFEWWVNSGTFDYYFWTGTANGAPAHVLFRGMMNGYVIFIAPLAILYAAGRSWSESSRLATFAVASVAANFIPIFLAWAVLSRSSYIYYMLPSIPAIACALALVAFVVPRSTRWAFLGLVVYGFIMSFPFRRF